LLRVYRRRGTFRLLRAGAVFGCKQRRRADCSTGGAKEPAGKNQLEKPARKNQREKTSAKKPARKNQR